MDRGRRSLVVERWKMAMATRAPARVAAEPGRRYAVTPPTYAKDTVSAHCHNRRTQLTARMDTPLHPGLIEASRWLSRSGIVAVSLVLGCGSVATTPNGGSGGAGATGASGRGGSMDSSGAAGRGASGGGASGGPSAIGGAGGNGGASGTNGTSGTGGITGIGATSGAGSGPDGGYLIDAATDTTEGGLDVIDAGWTDSVGPYTPTPMIVSASCAGGRTVLPDDVIESTQIVSAAGWSPSSSALLRRSCRLASVMPYRWAHPNPAQRSCSSQPANASYDFMG